MSLEKLLSSRIIVWHSVIAPHPHPLPLPVLMSFTSLSASPPRIHVPGISLPAHCEHLTELIAVYVQVHRLDAETGGLLLVAKTRQALRSLTQALQAREVNKRYTALVGGWLQGKGTIEHSLDGKPCATEWRALQAVQSRRHSWVTTVELIPITSEQSLSTHFHEVCTMCQHITQSSIQVFNESC